MAKKDRKLLVLLYDEFFQKVRLDWSLKYGRAGVLLNYKDITQKMDLCKQIRENILDAITPGKLLPKDVVSVHTLNRILGAESISTESDEVTLKMFALYLGYKSWNDFARQKQQLLDINAMGFELDQNLENRLDAQLNSELALIQLSEKLKNAKLVLNTRIVGNRVGKSYYTKKTAVWNHSIQDYLQVEGKYFKDILSDVMLEEASQFQTYEGYRAFHLPISLPSFMNFVILEFENQPSEIWLGWTISEYHGLEQPIYRSVDPQLVQVFKSWFYDLLHSCRALPLADGTSARPYPLVQD